MSYPKSNPDTNPDSPASSGFDTQSQMGLPEVLQMCCASRRSGQITYRSGESYGFIFIQHGRVLHALCGNIEGEDAIYTMLTWPGGGFSLNEDILPHKKTITLTWEQLLFEGARRADEGTITSRGPSSGPVITANPNTSSRQAESQPKLIITRPDLPPAPYDLVHEYTHVGRASGNEIPLPYPSVSSRHCIFILSGPDIVLRDLNSSNGTLVNGDAINETILRPGDSIQVGIVKMSFEAGIKRPKLQAVTGPLSTGTQSLSMNKTSRPITRDTVKLPSRLAAQGSSGKTDSSYVKGESAISYEDLAQPEVKQKSTPWGIILGIGVFLVLAAVSYFYFFAKH